MRFWDTSAIVPLCTDQPASRVARSLLRDDPDMAVWWGTLIECWSAFARLRREGLLDLLGEDASRSLQSTLHESWTEILPSEEIRTHAGRLLRVHPLRASDALQLAAALGWAGSPPRGAVVAFDRRLQEAARLESLRPVP